MDDRMQNFPSTNSRLTVSICIDACLPKDNEGKQAFPKSTAQIVKSSAIKIIHLYLLKTKKLGGSRSNEKGDCIHNSFIFRCSVVFNFLVYSIALAQTTLTYSIFFPATHAQAKAGEKLG